MPETGAAAPLVSIVIPTFNGAATLPAVLDAIDAQAADFAFEVIVFDSGSTDATLALLEGRVTRVATIPAGSFNHGLTRNQGIAAARGALAVLLVQDAIPASADWLARLVEPLRRDPTLAGTFARQVPHEGASPLTRHYLARWIAASPAARVAALRSPEEWNALTPMERYLRCVFDNVCSCVRRSVWADHPFRETPIAEDVEWAKEVLLAGHRLAFVPEAVVRHSHERPARYELWRTYLVHRRLRELFGVREVPTPLHLALAMAICLFSHLRCLASEGALLSRHLGRALALAVVFPAGQYLGALAADTGWSLLRPRGV